MGNSIVARGTMNPARRSTGGKDLILSEATGGDWVLADCSGSMDCPTPEPGMRRIDCLRQAIAPMAHRVRVIAFGLEQHYGRGADRYALVEAREVPSNEIPEALGGATPMHAALALVAPRRAEHVLIVSDGHVNSYGRGQLECQDLAREAAQEVATTAIIDTMYIGYDDPEAEAFMQELARIGHGRYQRWNLSQKALGFTAAVAGLLPPPANSVIAL